MFPTLKYGSNVTMRVIQLISNQIAIPVVSKTVIKPYLTNGFSHHYHLSESTFILGVLGVIFIFLSYFSMKFLCANRIAPDGTSRSAYAYVPQKGRQAYMS